MPEWTGIMEEGSSSITPLICPTLLMKRGETEWEISNENEGEERRAGGGVMEKHVQSKPFPHIFSQVTNSEWHYKNIPDTWNSLFNTQTMSTIKISSDSRRSTWIKLTSTETNAVKSLLVYVILLQHLSAHLYNLFTNSYEFIKKGTSYCDHSTFVIFCNHRPHLSLSLHLSSYFCWAEFDPLL